MIAFLGLGFLVVLCGLPTALSSTALLWQRFGPGPSRAPQRDATAGAWLERQVAERGLSVGLEVHGAAGLDAYWPGVDAIGLSAGTWHGRRATDLAVAAHELGHALNVRSHPLAAHALPTARLAQSLAWRAFAATVFSAVLVNAPGLVPFATALLIFSVAVTTVVCLDEWFASQRAAQMLRDDATVSDDDVAVAVRSMRGAGSIYASDWVGQGLVLLAWPTMVANWPSLSFWSGALPSTEAIGLTLVLFPILVLRAAQVGLQVWQPEPVTTDFRLFTLMHRESRWEFLTGIAVLTVVVLLHPLLTDALGTSVLVGATVTAMGPVGILARAFVLVPIVLLLHRFTTRDPDEPRVLLRPPDPDVTAPALLALYTDPPWYLRGSWLANLAYLPLLVVLVVRLCTMT